MVGPNSSRLTESFQLLTHPYRRYVLYYLTTESGVVGINTLATAIASWEGDQSDPGRNTDRTRVEIGLRHIHLPKLAEDGFISIGADGDSVERGDATGIDRVLADAARIDEYVKTAAGD